MFGEVYYTYPESTSQMKIGNGTKVITAHVQILILHRKSYIFHEENMSRETFEH